MPEQIQGSGNPFAESDFIRDSFGGTLVACVKQIRYTVKNIKFIVIQDYSLRQRMKQENRQPVKQHKRMNGLADRKLLAGLVFAVGDYIALTLSALLALYLRNIVMTYNVYHINLSYIFFWVPLVFMPFILYSGLYTKRMLTYKMTEKLFYASLYGTVFSIILMFIAQVAGEVSRLFVIFFVLFNFILLCFVRFLTNKILRKLRLLQIPILILGAGLSGEAITKEIRKDSGMGYKIIGFLEDNKPKTEYINRYPILGGFGDLEKVVRETSVESVLIAAPGLSQSALSDLIYRAQFLVKDVGVIPNLVGVPMSNIEAESFFDAKIMVLHIKNNLARKSNQIVKRLFDVAATIIGGICILPVLFIVAAWIYHDSPGPVIYKHRRIGKNGKEFDCYKFRSMCVNSQEVLEELLASDPAAKEEWDRDFKLKNDPRITRSGAFLRKTSLDELPQLINVLKGEMSLVGPRPIVRKEVPRYEKFIKEYYSVLPGITGVWQVSGRSDIDYPERVRMDSWYVHNWSIWLDIVMLWRTVSVVLKRKGAY
jgi:Undecaprenyl-phosphate galactose phosphotransferase WbaP